MGLKGDFDELKDIWPSLPLSFKIFLLISFLVSFLSITSIADSVYGLRGFIKTAIEFYQYAISPVFLSFLSLLNIEVTQVKADVMLLITLMSASLIRANYIYKAFGTPIDVGTWGVFIYITYSINDDVVYEVVYGYFGTMLLFAILPSVFKELKKSRVFMSYKLGLLNILSLVFLVSIVAAISEGLSRAI